MGSHAKFPRPSVIIAIVMLAGFVGTLFAADMDGVMMSNGKMMMMKAGRPAMAMENPVTMSDGTSVSVDGTVKLKDGTEFHLQNGEMIMMDGHLMKGGKPAPMSQ